MNATLARLEPEPTPFGSAQCTEELTQINESLHRRESLLTASAKASRLLLEAPDVRAVVPKVLGLIGEAARVDRVNLMLTKAGPNGEPLLEVVNEWVAEGVVPYLDDAAMPTCDERKFSGVCAELRAGRSVCLSMRDSATECESAGFEGIGTKTKAIVPIFVAGEFIGVVGFDNTKQCRAVDSAELAALETAAGVIGAALHRERLVDDVRRERERAAEERVTELAKANQVIRGNLERLAREPDLGSFMGHMLLEAARQFDAASGAVIVSKESLQEWRIVAHVRDGQVEPPPFQTSVPFTDSPFTNTFAAQHEPMYINLEREHQDIWPGALAFHRSEGYIGVVVYPLVFGERNVGFFMLTFRRNAEDVQRSELLVALAQQATLAIQLTRLAHSAKEAAVLVERTRIGQEIHDGLAQSFTGILMQLGAAEEFPSCKRKNSELSTILSRIRDLARDGLSEARRSVMALRLDQTRRAGLEIALRQLAERSTVPGGVTCIFEGGGIATGLKPEHEHELFRISQEAVSNAVRHGRPRIVNITMTDGPAHWELAVADDGVGMEKHLELYAGEGFGLSSMRQRAGAIGGEWQIESRPGRRHTHQRPDGETGTVMVAVIKRKIRVILADDHPVVRDGLAAMVNQQADMEVVAEAGDGEEAIALYEEHRPDVMVLDLRMPKRDGVAVVQRVLEINPKACLLIMTTYDGDEDIFQCLSQGAKGYLLKDAPRQEILSAIRAVSEDRPYTSSSVAAKALQRMAKPSLTQRELDVLQLVAQGRSNKDIARRLAITEGTAKTHVKAILTKLDAISRTEAVAVAHKRGMIRL